MILKWGRCWSICEYVGVFYFLNVSVNELLSKSVIFLWACVWMYICFFICVSVWFAVIADGAGRWLVETRQKKTTKGSCLNVCQVLFKSVFSICLSVIILFYLSVSVNLSATPSVSLSASLSACQPFSLCYFVCFFLTIHQYVCLHPFFSLSAYVLVNHHVC